MSHCSKDSKGQDGVTHHEGCYCHEERHRKEVADLNETLDSEEMIAEDLDNALHALLTELNVPTSEAFPGTACDGSHARVKALAAQRDEARLQCSRNKNLYKNLYERMDVTAVHIEALTHMLELIAEESSTPHVTVEALRKLAQCALDNNSNGD